MIEIKQLSIEMSIRTRWQGANKKIKEIGYELDWWEMTQDP
jgi:hypothetical protein